MRKFLIFKTDRLGDLLNISPIISNIKKNDPNNDITLICSKYNSSIAKYYKKNLNFIIYKKPLIFFLIKNFKLIFNKKYDVVLQLDGKKHSYFISMLVGSCKKLCLQFIKNKKILGFLIKIKRPNLFVNLFFDFKEISYEDYNHVNNKNFHYLTLYLKLLEKINIKIFSKNHNLPIKNVSVVSKFKENYVLLHIDKRWDSYSKNTIISLIEILNEISKSNKIVISSNPGGSNTFKLITDNLISNTNIELIHQPNLHDVLSLVYYSSTCISSHTGLIVHSAAAFKKNIIDVVPSEIFSELDRWIPFNINYKRLNIENLSHLKSSLKF